MDKKILVGAHTSTAKGVHNALLRGKEIGATVVQLFTSNQKQWKGRVFKEEDIQLFHQALSETNITHVMSHDSYLINLGSPKLELLEKSRFTFEEELKRCHLLDLDYLNFHPGTATDGNTEKCLDTIVESLLSMEALVNKGSTRLLLETTAGQGSTVGYLFEHLSYIIQRVEKKIPIGTCIDTCHIFAAGYDITSEEGWDKTLDAFDQTIGLNHLYAFHLNDSLKELGSRRDRHANLGKGQIGIKSFQYLMQHPKTKDLPKYLETPNGDLLWEEEIEQLKSFHKERMSESV